MTLNHNYLIMDTQNHALANGEVVSPPGETPIRLNILDNKVDDVTAHEVIILLSSSSEELPVQCRILRSRGDMVMAEKIATLDPEVRRNLRVPVKFDTFIYPVASSYWKGRQPVQSIDLSCGGIAFYSDFYLEVHDEVEIVVTPTEEPVILHCEVLKRQELQNRFMYATKFVDLCEDEEVAVREAVFSLQLQARDTQD
ncbi:PilZ domain-containing protein [uncultured Oscillibacter sp.]|uniref:PilZ domain-containing protein n=1 Tax=uncultured Oscillibacter sp. TaxID=876091 RepID=UPI0025FD25B0|nr:PilZ domain-containing protein [uncultured Oscillibacter sp.]